MSIMIDEYKKNRYISIIYILAMLVFVTIQLTVICSMAWGMENVRGYFWDEPYAVAGLNFTCASAIFGCIYTMSKENRKRRVLCTILLVVNISFGLLYAVDCFLCFFNSDFDGIDLCDNLKNGIYVIVILCAIGTFLVESNSFNLKDKMGIVFAVTRALEMEMIFLFTLPLFEWGSNDFHGDVSIIMLNLAICLTTLSSIFEKKKVKLILCFASWAVLLMPVIYLIRKYWGLPGVLIYTVSIVSALGAFACAIIAVFNVFKKAKNETLTKVESVTVSDEVETELVYSAPVSAEPAIVADTWKCESCGASGNDGNFCENCGEKKREYWFCTSCGTKNHKQFCGKCGQKKDM